MSVDTKRARELATSYRDDAASVSHDTFARILLTGAVALETAEILDAHADEVDRLREESRTDTPQESQGDAIDEITRRKNLTRDVERKWKPLLAAAEEASGYLDRADHYPMEKQAALELDRTIAACKAVT